MVLVQVKLGVLRIDCTALHDEINKGNQPGDNYRSSSVYTALTSKHARTKTKLLNEFKTYLGFMPIINK